jgi:hypothetical protein
MSAPSFLPLTTYREFPAQTMAVISRQPAKSMHEALKLFFGLCLTYRI